ncbi:creatininase family protein [Salinarchaeum chitinilyticum]
MHLAEAAWTDVRALETELAVLPVGSTEQHGPHAPLSTDTLAAEAVAAAGAERFGQEENGEDTAGGNEIVVAPAIPFGVAEEHRQFDGTMWVGEDTFRSYVRDAAKSLAHHGFDRIVFVNGHGGNVDALREVAGRLSRDGDAYAVPFTWFDSVDAPDMGHAGPVETSMLRHVAPELVRDDRLDEAVAGASDGWGEWVAGVNLAFDSAEFSESGVVGDPMDADADRGDALLSAAAEALVVLLEAVGQRDPPGQADD